MSDRKNSNTDASGKPLLIIIMGVSGSGKSSVAERIANEFDFVFYEADDFHSEINKAHMAEGKPLNDEMREPWINSLCEVLGSARIANKNCVLAYSGLRRSHRQRFRELGYTCCFILLSGDSNVIAERMSQRTQHFMPASLLESQLASFEMPSAEEPVEIFDINKPLPELTSEILAYLNLSSIHQ